MSLITIKQSLKESSKQSDTNKSQSIKTLENPQFGKYPYPKFSRFPNCSKKFPSPFNTCPCSQEQFCSVLEKHSKNSSFHSLAHLYEKSLEEKRQLVQALRNRDKEILCITKELHFNELQLQQDVRTLYQMIEQKDSIHQKELDSITQLYAIEKQNKKIYYQNLMELKNENDGLKQKIDSLEKQKQKIWADNMALSEKMLLGKKTQIQGATLQNSQSMESDADKNIGQRNVDANPIKNMQAIQNEQQQNFRCIWDQLGYGIDFEDDQPERWYWRYNPQKNCRQQLFNVRMYYFKNHLQYLSTSEPTPKLVILPLVQQKDSKKV